MEQKGSNWIRFAPFLVLAAVLLVVLAWTTRDRSPERPGTVQETPAVTAPEPGPSMTDLERSWTAATGAPPVWTEDMLAPSDCGEVVDELRALASRLDRREYVQGWELPDGVYGLLTGSALDLAANRPAVTGEMNRLDTVLANVSHGYLVLGRYRLERLLRIAREDPDRVEPLALALFRWMQVRDRCSDPADRGPGIHAQYDYAAFLLNSLGGQAYLRRRPARIESLAGFYALVILDRSIQEGYNPYGLDPVREIERYRQMLAGQNLLFTDRYVQLLNEMERRHIRMGG